ncbi:MAG: hypothetical protein H6977_05525 [Gammaproteobacteria bacterium]|nr:hypothetical protein [Gammaproteobacteria bacterium]MCP5199449.1 hypothetical protein [Gammaproteobacteria bacterium]
MKPDRIATNGAAQRGAVVLLALLLLGGCVKPLAPQDVADRFWRAVVAGQPAKTRRYVLTRDRDQIEQGEELLPISRYALGRIVIDGDNASVATEITLDGDQPVTLDIDTVMAREQGQWRIDYEATVAEISARGELAQIIQQIGAIGDTLKQGVEQSVDEMKRALPTIESELRRLEGEIKQRVPELREKLDAFSRSLEEALKQRPPPPAPNPPATDPDQPIAL